MPHLLLFGLFFAVVLTSSEGCELTEKCRFDDTPSGFPETEEDLDAFCEFGIKSFQCVFDFEDECEPPYPEYPRHSRDLFSALKLICDKETLLHSAIIENLPCFKTSQTDMTCYWKFTEDRDFKKFAKLLLTEEITEVASNKNDTKICMRELFYASCTVATVGNACGEIARDIVIEVVQVIDFVFESCNPGIKEKLPAIARALELEYKQELEVEETFEKK